MTYTSSAAYEWDIPAKMRLDSPLHEVLAAYTAAQSPGYHQLITDLTNQVVQHANEALRTALASKKIAQIVQIPVAAAQEKELQHTLLHYAHQADAPNFIVLLSCNWPEGSNMDDVRATIATVQQFQQEYSAVALGFYEIEYAPHIKMGTIQKHIADVAVDLLLRAAVSPGPNEDIMLISHAADIVSMSPHYLHSMYDTATKTEPGEIVTWLEGRTSHAPSNGVLPNLDMLIAWYDFRVAQSGGYELGMAVSLRAYAACGGISGEHISREWTELCRSIHERKTYGHAGQKVAEGAICTVSPRRLHYKLREEGAELHRMWNKDQFGTEESYRTYTTSEDILDEVRDQLIRDFMRSHGQALLDLIIDRLQTERGHTKEDARQAALQLLHEAQRTIGDSVDPLPILSF